MFYDVPGLPDLLWQTLRTLMRRRSQSSASFISRLDEKRCGAEDANAKKSLSTALLRSEKGAN
jgi:predicted DNA-binding ribbon-helix-helix protein